MSLKIVPNSDPDFVLKTCALPKYVIEYSMGGCSFKVWGVKIDALILVLIIYIISSEVMRKIKLLNYLEFCNSKYLQNITLSI